MSKTVLITGGTGLVGSRLTELLKEKGYNVRFMTRNPKKSSDIALFGWDVGQGTIDESALENVDYIMHLAGAGVADKPWSKERKKEIRDSRTKSTQLLKDTLEKNAHQVKAFISASAIGYYGWDSGGVWKKEDSRFGDDFLATVTKVWEAEVDEIDKLGIRTVKLRIGVVLSEKGGALKEITKPIKWGVGAPLGPGDQYMSWIHLDDLCNMFIYAMENENTTGIYNAVAPNPVTNKELSKLSAKMLNKPFFLPNVPGFVLKLILGEMASMILGGSRVSPEKIQQAGFRFDFTEIKPALQNLLT
ncbi:TIGR01777 family protein [Fulvivirga sp. M361]|uniref:TIGR01777 family oxidoreductase n=1 Tax=Fulvivirga sp. M361 TaxID=2594266 RepID=UPI00117A2779|nr:TIGR01777 family oxidoreductase [Fulvivirga sp. M361]TRX50909.1 TIGR01777 family protein [Fulvivirga sp. M361]